MIRKLFPAALLFIASAALAQTPADISVAIVADPVVDGNQTINWQIDVTNHGPGIAQDVEITGSSDLSSRDCGGLIPSIDPGTHTLVPCSTSAPLKEMDLVLTAKAETIDVFTPDPDLTNNVATKTVHATGGPDLGIFFKVPESVTPGVPFDISVSYYNSSLTSDATGVVVTLAIPSAARIVAMPANCAQASTVVCTIGTVPAHTNPGAPPTLTLTGVVDEAKGGQVLQFGGDVKGNEPEASLSNNHATASAQVFRTFYVTDTADSLADAIDQANLHCTDNFPCKIAFHLGTPPDSGYFTLKPHRALPAITGKNVFIDGSTQTRLTGDTNPNGPEIFVDGSENEWEDAIVFDEPCGGELGFVAIGNFKNAAVTMSGSSDTSFGPCGADVVVSAAAVHDSYLGVDPTGTAAAPNGRGVVVSENLPFGAVTNNLISGNRRSGVWIGMSGGLFSVYDNTIGIDVHHQPLANGASGIYIGPLVNDLGILNNYIAFNHDFGVAIDRNAAGVNLAWNSIFANWQLGIDIGLDGPTPDRDGPAPVIVSAQYDPAQNKTIVVLSTPPEPSLGESVTAFVYASDAPHPSGYGDGQYFLARQDFDPASGGATISIYGDWRGKWVSATATRYQNFGLSLPPGAHPSYSSGFRSTTSEFSRAVKVE